MWEEEAVQTSQEGGRAWAGWGCEILARREGKGRSEQGAIFSLLLALRLTWSCPEKCRTHGSLSSRSPLSWSAESWLEGGEEGDDSNAVLLFTPP